MLRIQIFILSILQALDIITTLEGLKLTGVEINPFMRNIVGNIGLMIFVKFVSVLVVGLVAWFVARKARFEMICALMAAIGFMIAVVLMNTLSVMFMKGII